ncbi:MAG TPA: DUF493 family protein [Aequorivita sp.]|nr:DUF493 family protein [Aequorivita sp.]
MEKDTKAEEFYKRLKSQLEEDTSWPSPFLFKFIVPAELDKIAEVRVVFDGMNADIVTRDSKNGKYTSISIRVTMDSPDAVIEKYLQVSKVEGVISL